METYINTLAKLNAHVLDSYYANVFYMGDFNCHIEPVLFDELDKFCQDNEYILSDVNKLGIDSNTATFISDANGDYRWLDHIVSSFSANHMIKSISVLNYFIISDHRPIQMVLIIKNDLISNNYNINDDVHDRFID